MLLDADSALQDQWTAQVRARWAAHRAKASETGATDGAWLDGDAAEAIACDAWNKDKTKVLHSHGPPARAG
jgi:hypothetical protein